MTHDTLQTEGRLAFASLTGKPRAVHDALFPDEQRQGFKDRSDFMIRVDRDRPRLRKGRNETGDERMIRPYSFLVLQATTVLALVLAAAGSARADEALHVVINVDVLPDHMAEGQALLKAEGESSRHDAGYGAWQLLQRRDHGNHFAIVEVWSSEADFDRHIATEHAKSTRRKLQPLLASPFDERLFSLVE
jgi:quinol monooxygenase YgiN